MSNREYSNGKPPKEPEISLSQIERQIAKYWRAREDGKVEALEALVKSAGLEVRRAEVNRFIRELEAVEQRWQEQEKRVSRLLLFLMAEAAQAGNSALLEKDLPIEDAIDLYRSVWQRMQKNAPKTLEQLVPPEEIAQLLGGSEVPAIFDVIDELVNRLFDEEPTPNESDDSET